MTYKEAEEALKGPRLGSRVTLETKDRYDIETYLYNSWRDNKDYNVITNFYERVKTFKLKKL